MKVPKIEQFKLIKLKRKQGELDVHWDVETVTEENIYHDKDHKNSDKAPHEDMVNILRSMRDKLGAIWGLLPDDYPKVNITGISMTGKDDKLGVVITGTYKLPSGHVQPINSHKINFSSEYYGFEEELQKNCEDLEVEAYEYIWNDKIADSQTAMFSDDEMEGES